MKAHRTLIYMLILAGLATPTLQGCKAMAYPLALAFGGPTEPELKKIRPAFATLTTHARTGAVVVYPPLVIKLKGGDHAWDEGAGPRLVAALQRGVAPGAALAPAVPDTSFEPMGHNQMRFLWKRARGYASWVESRRPAGDYFVFTELLTDAQGEKVFGAQFYVVDAQGQIAHTQLWNSHHFDPAALSGIGAFLDWMARDVVKALERDPLTQYPPYGVG